MRPSTHGSLLPIPHYVELSKIKSVVLFILLVTTDCVLLMQGCMFQLSVMKWTEIPIISSTSIVVLGENIETCKSGSEALGRAASVLQLLSLYSY